MTRAREIVAGFALMLVASTTAVHHFLTHNHYENSGSIPYLVALGVAEMFLVGLSWRLIFLPLTPPTTTQGHDRAGALPRLVREPVTDAELRERLATRYRVYFDPSQDFKEVPR